MRIAPAMLAAALALTALPLASPAAAPVAAANGSCTDWSSTTEPPSEIRVYRVNQGTVDIVDFKAYVVRVASREWNVKQGALRHAGVHAVKQYAWYHVLNWRGGMYEGECFDVRDSTADQLYSAKPLRQIPRRIKRAVNRTWSWRLFRGDTFIMTGYQLGKKNKACAEDAGYRLRVRSARKCANQGWSAQEILEVYYTAELIR